MKRSLTYYAADLVVPLIGFLLMLIFPNQLNFLTLIATTAIFILSLDLVVGYAGIATLGHAALFGVGAYSAGLYAIHISSEPLSGLFVGVAAGAFLAFFSALIIMRAHGLTLLMMTVAIAQIVQEVANKARFITGGDDGLSGISVDPILGLFAFDFLGQTGFMYVLIVLTIVFALLRRFIRSPFGLTTMGIRDDAGRVSSLGGSVFWHLVKVYVIAGAVAGLAGGLSAQTVRVVSLSSLGFNLSAEALVMLVLGGTGRLWGALAGTLLFMMIHHYAAEIDPFRWMFVIGAMLITVVLLVPGGLANGVARLAVLLKRRTQRV